jgi:uncharacterized protein (TIGR03437 family)
MKLSGFAMFILGAAACFAQPVIKTGGIVNAASWAVAGTPNSDIAQGSIFIVSGSGLGPTTLTQAPGAYPLPTSVGGVKVTISMNGTDTDAILFWVRNDYIAALLPSTVATGTGTVTVTYNSQTSNAAPITVVDNAIGIFTISQNGQGPGVVTDGAKPQTSVKSMLVTPTNSAKPNDTAVLWVTGLGAVPWDESKAPASTLNLQSKLNAKVWVGATPVTPTFSGPSGCCEGEGQIQFKVPPGETGCYVSVTVQVGNNVSNTVTMAVDNSGQTCSDQFGYSSSLISKLQTGGTVRIGSLALTRLLFEGSGISLPPTVSASGSFFSYTADTFSAASGQFPSLNSCVVTQNLSGNNVPGGTGTGLDAGASIGLTGPNGNATLTSTAGTKGLYSANLNSNFLDASSGNYVFTGTGGVDVGAFTATLPATAALTWANQASITAVSRSAGQPITWTGGDPNGFVMIAGSSQSQDNANKSFVCLAPVSAGSFTIPASVLLALPASDNGGLIVYSFGQPATFTATGLDYGSVTEGSGAGSLVAYQ